MKLLAIRFFYQYDMDDYLNTVTKLFQTKILPYMPDDSGPN